MSVPESQPNQRPVGDADAPAEAPSEGSVTGSVEADLVLEVTRLETALREASDRQLRTQAELENFRKRSRRELEDERRYGALPLMRDMLQVVDNLQRAIEAAEKSPSSGGLLEGVKMVAVQMTTFLDQHQCRPIAALGAAFDPQWHEAIGQVPSSEVPPGHVAQVARMGYTLHDRVVRPAQVLVSLGNPAAASGAST